jgi:phosphomannomutase
MSYRNNKKVLVFDLDDTLAESKQRLDREMSDLLESLISKGIIVAVTSGGSFEQFDKQFLASLHFLSAHFENLYLMPTSGASMYKYETGKWNQVYNHELDENEKSKIISVLEESIKNLGFWEEKSYGNLIENRNTQITYSGLGQNAPLKLKEVWDPKQTKRKQIVEKIKDELTDYDINIGGKTSIDITKKGVNKALGINELSKRLNIPIENMIFIGDALYDGGNDARALESGIDSIQVSGVKETKEILKELIRKN